MPRGRPTVVLAAVVASAWISAQLAAPPARSFATPAAARSRLLAPARGQANGSGAAAGARSPAAGAAAAGEPWGLRAIASLAAAAALIVGVCAGASPSQAFFGMGKSGEIIGEFQASGMVFKDTLDVERITDPKVKGVTLYQTDFSKSALDKAMQGNLLASDSGASGLACIADGPVLISKDLSKDKSGEEIFSEDKGLGKKLKIRRVYDETSKNLVYVVFTERFMKSDNDSGSRFKSVACAIHVTGQQ